MKLNRTIITLVAATGLIAFTPGLYAQAPAAPKAPAVAPKAPASTNAAAGERGGRGAYTPEARLAAIDQAVTLTADQKPKVKAIIDDETKKREAMQSLPQEERRTKMTALREETTKKMKEVLTPEQFTKYEAMPQRRGGARGQTGQPGQSGQPAQGATPKKAAQP